MESYLISTITDFIDAPIALVYSIVTDNRNFQWREEVKDIELLEEGFIEYYKAGGHTLFSNIRKIENEYYAFTMQNLLSGEDTYQEFLFEAYGSSFLEFETYTTELYYSVKSKSICKQISTYIYGFQRWGYMPCIK